jgi:hypothetical protein
LAARQQALAKTLSKLGKIATEFNVAGAAPSISTARAILTSPCFLVAVVMTNQVVSDPSGDANGLLMTDTKRPVGGHVMAHASTTRLFFKFVSYPSPFGMC